MSKIALLTAGSLLALAVPAVPAFAHVTAQSPGATQGGFAKIAFRVPTEKDVPTTKVEIAFPADSPLAFVSVKPHVGWTYEVVKAALPEPVKNDDGELTEAVSTITWTATEGGIKPGEFDEFEVSAGPLPEKDEIVFKALQTYSDGEVVRWIEGEGADKPAPRLALAPKSGEAHGGASSASAEPTASPGAVSVSAEAASEDEDGNALAGAALGVGVLALLASGAVAIAGRRRA